MNELINFQTLIVPLSTALALSIIVERILEIAKNILEPLLIKRELPVSPDIKGIDKKINEIKDRHEYDKDLKEAEENATAIHASLEKEKDQGKREKLLEKLNELEKKAEFGEQPSKSEILVVDATDPDDGLTTKRLILQLLGFSAGIILARASGVQLFHSFVIGEAAFPAWADYLMTGLLIGGGSAPIHTLIRFITERKVVADQTPVPAEKEEKEKTEPKKENVPGIVTTLTDIAAKEWVEIPYNGGVDREILENVHKRITKVDGKYEKVKPDLIVFHHTAMDSRSSFENVVRVIKNRKTSSGQNWLTGYNCVILADGSVHPFCRWDRYGNHAVGYNIRSLGVAFNGNFESNPNIPYSNPDGKYGALRPTELQLKAGARLITLWTFLYNIQVDFKKTILPHKVIAHSPKACPGGSFPYEELQKWVEFYHDRWPKSDAIMERIEAYKLKPYVY